MINKFKIFCEKNIYILLMVNIVITTVAAFNATGSKEINFVNVEGSSVNQEQVQLKRAICEQAFKSLQNGKVLAELFHTSLLETIEKVIKSKDNLTSVNKFYFKFEGRDLCKVVGRKENGFIAYEAIVSRSGPLFYQISTLEPYKPTLKDIEAYL